MNLTILKNYCLKPLQLLERACAACCSWLIIQIRPFFGPLNICPYPVGCTQFALESLESDFVVVAVTRIAFRLLKCNPVYFQYKKFFNLRCN